MAIQTKRGEMIQPNRIKRAEAREAIRNEWFSLYLLDEDKKTHQTRRRMRVLFSQFMVVR